jgi:hypothetical protein
MLKGPPAQILYADRIRRYRKAFGLFQQRLTERLCGEAEEAEPRP